MAKYKVVNRSTCTDIQTHGKIQRHESLNTYRHSNTRENMSQATQYVPTFKHMAKYKVVNRSTLKQMGKYVMGCSTRTKIQKHGKICHGPLNMYQHSNTWQNTSWAAHYVPTLKHMGKIRHGPTTCTNTKINDKIRHGRLTTYKHMAKYVMGRSLCTNTQTHGGNTSWAYNMYQH